MRARDRQGFASMPSASRCDKTFWMDPPIHTGPVWESIPAVFPMQLETFLAGLSRSERNRLIHFCIKLRGCAHCMEGINDYAEAPTGDARGAYNRTP